MVCFAPRRLLYLGLYMSSVQSVFHVKKSTTSAGVPRDNFWGWTGRDAVCGAESRVCLNYIGGRDTIGSWGQFCEGEFRVDCKR